MTTQANASTSSIPSSQQRALSHHTGPRWAARRLRLRYGSSSPVMARAITGQVLFCCSPKMDHLIATASSSPCREHGSTLSTMQVENEWLQCNSSFLSPPPLSHTRSYSLSLVEGDQNEVSGMEISKDHSTWKYYEVQGSNYLVQPTVVRPTPGKSYLLAYFRDRR